jgi:predicted TIM-barrel fold metal-dependent hydrolase
VLLFARNAGARHTASVLWVADPTRPVSPHVPVVDANVHLWDQSSNPVFWLSDRALLRDMLGNYDSLPASYSLGDYERDVAQVGVTGVVWSDAGAADPVLAVEWVLAQDHDGMIVGMVSLADPMAPDFEETVRRLAAVPQVTSVRIRLVGAMAAPPSVSPGGDDAVLLDRIGVLDELGLVATLELEADQLDTVTTIARAFPELRIVLDHFGWPDDLTPPGRRAHLRRLGMVAAAANVSTRLDAIGTIFGQWDVDQIRPWLQGAVDAFGADRCMLGSDTPIESLRSTFTELHAAYDDIFSAYGIDDRRLLFGGTALSLYAAPT